MFGQDPHNDRARQTASLQAPERRNNVERNARQPISITHICVTFRIMMDTHHELILP